MLATNLHAPSIAAVCDSRGHDGKRSCFSARCSRSQLSLTCPAWMFCRKVDRRFSASPPPITPATSSASHTPIRLRSSSLSCTHDARSGRAPTGSRRSTATLRTRGGSRRSRTLNDRRGRRAPWTLSSPPSAARNAEQEAHQPACGRRGARSFTGSGASQLCPQAGQVMSTPVSCSCPATATG